MNHPERFSDIKQWERAKGVINEDVVRISTNGSALALSDGATDKTGIRYEGGKSGGYMLATISSETAASSMLNGYPLAVEITQNIRNFYAMHNRNALSDSSARAATTLVVARIVEDNLVVTQIGDSNFRVTYADGKQEVVTNDKIIDTENANLRKAHIENGLSDFANQHGRQPSQEEYERIVANGRDAILEQLKTQHIYQNSSSTETPYSYGTLDGSTIPEQFTTGDATNFVRVFSYPLSSIKSIELASDGFYGAFPDTSTPEAYAALYAQIHETDPDKYTTHLSTKSLDDAAVVMATVAS